MNAAMLSIILALYLASSLTQAGVASAQHDNSAASTYARLAPLLTGAAYTYEFAASEQALPVPLSAELLRSITSGPEPLCGPDVLDQLDQLAVVVLTPLLGGATSSGEGGTALSGIDSRSGHSSTTAEDAHRQLTLYESVKGLFGWLAKDSGCGGLGDVDCLREQHRRRLQQSASAFTSSPGAMRNVQYNYYLPPVPPPEPSSYPPNVLLPLVFHVMLYRDAATGVVGPPGYDSAPALAARTVAAVNLLASGTGVRFFLQEVRGDPQRYPYLLVGGPADWQTCGAVVSGGLDESAASPDCLRAQGVMVDFPRAINVYFVGSSTLFAVPRGGTNGPESYNAGSSVLWHELGHYLGLSHTFPTDGKCADSDGVPDTPNVAATASSLYLDKRLAVDLNDHCYTVFMRDLQGDLGAAPSRVGIPDSDKNAWADTCPDDPGYDELGNFMTYTLPSCRAGLGHMTPGQSPLRYPGCACKDLWLNYLPEDRSPTSAANLAQRGTVPVWQGGGCAPYYSRSNTRGDWACEVEDGCTVNGKTYGGAGVALILPCEGAKFMCTPRVCHRVAIPAVCLLEADRFCNHYNHIRLRSYRCRDEPTGTSSSKVTIPHDPASWWCELAAPCVVAGKAYQQPGTFALCDERAAAVCSTWVPAL
eukprot:XP_001690468.1 predicted protein [Chlamydomonas reinhardtii]